MWLYWKKHNLKYIKVRYISKLWFIEFCWENDFDPMFFFSENFITKKTFVGTFRMNYVNQIWFRESHEVNFVSRSYFATRIMACAPTAMLLLLLLIKSNCLKIQLDCQKLEKSKLTKEKNDALCPAIA